MSVLQLEQQIGQGTRRTCFLHPEDPNCCVKVANADLDDFKIGQAMNANRIELEFWHKQVRDDEVLRDHFPAVHGNVATDRGEGLVLELVRDGDGTISPKLSQFRKGANETQIEILRGQLSLIRHEIIRRHIQIIDWGAQNMLVQCEGESLVLKVVDFETRPNMARWFKRMKSARKARRFLPKI